jgi:pimeloyl-ACP methyl ester carboxylesterase
MADAAGGAVRWQTFGSGPRAAVALHCSLAHSGEWAGVMTHLGDAVTMAAMDLPGHGRSADWDGTSDYIGTCGEAALDRTNDGPVDLIGHSGGAVAALHAALMIPEMVRTLTLIEPTLFAAVRGSAVWGDFAPRLEPFEAAARAGEMEDAARKFMGVWGDGTPWEDLEPRARAYFAGRIHLVPAAFPALYDDSLGLLDADRLEGLACPVMLIAGDASPPVILPIAEAIAARLPDVGVATVPGAGHMCPVTHAEQVAGLIRVNISRG